MRPKRTQLPGTVKGEAVEVGCEAMVCGRCGFAVLSAEQSDAFSMATADAYRRRHGLLTGDEIRALRARMGMSQARFAAYLRVGVASVKRWELGLVQDAAMDELMRVKCDPEYGREALEELRGLLDQRYDEMMSGAVEMIPGEEVAEYFRRKSAAARASLAGREPVR